MDLEPAIRRLPFWAGPVAIEPLAGGLTNVNFRVEDGAGTYVVRAGDDDPYLGIDRAHELACARLGAELGVAPEVVFAERPWSVARFVPGRTLDPPALADHGRLRRTARLLRTVHGARARVTGHLRWFSPFLVARTYLELAARNGWRMPFDAASVRATVDDLEARVAPFVPTFCHNDLMPGNLIEQGERLWLIDWEYAAMGNPLFDLAGVVSNAELDAAATAALVDAYCGEDLDARRVHTDLAVLLPMAALRESLWAVVHGARSEIEFDYDHYRDDNFARFERALAALRRELADLQPPGSA